MRLAFIVLSALVLQGCTSVELPEKEAVSTKPTYISGPVYELDALTVLPMPVQRKVPWYPAWARKKGISATVIVEFVITKEGKTGNIRVIESPDESFTNSVISAVEEWVYTPGEIDKDPVNSVVRETIPFNYVGN